MISILQDIGLYRQTVNRFAEPIPAVFLDRDGVIVEETNYLHRTADVRMISGAGRAIARLNQAAIPVVLVTNQAGVGRGYYTWTEFEAVQQYIEAAILRDGAHLDGVWACGYHPAGSGPLAKDHLWRKPQPGMLTDAAECLCIDLARSWLVGDKISDLEAGIAGGLAGMILVRTGYGTTHEPHVAVLQAHPSQRLVVADDLSHAIDQILSHSRL
ncbi:MAG: HAD family hydrolase [Bryobacteraceae bacterium]|nr:HAD family hydrolase [Bryobacteraceae bacterium]